MLLAFFAPLLLPLDTAGPRDRPITANRGDDSCTAGRFYGLLQFIKKSAHILHKHAWLSTSVEEDESTPKAYKAR